MGRSRKPVPQRTGPKYPGTCDFTSEPDENGKRWWEYRAIDLKQAEGEADPTPEN
jgi:hypothetical protein